MISRTYLDVDGVINSLNPLGGHSWPVPHSELTIHRCNGLDIHVPADMAANPCTGAIWIDDFGYALDQRFADAGVIGVDTTCAPGGGNPDLQLNVLLAAHLDGLGLEIPRFDQRALEECA